VMPEPLPGRAWDDATEDTDSYAVDAVWRIRVLREALRLACVDVVRLSAEGGPTPLEPPELADAYVETAEARLLLDEVDLEERAQDQGGSGAASGG
jgi:hypothetical protein